MKTKLLTIALSALTIGLLGSCKKEDPKVSVTDVRLDQPELTITVGDADVKLVATVTPDNATDKTVNWASDKAEVATVDNQGSVHAVAPGDATITVTTVDGGMTATCAVKVKAALPANALPGKFSVSATKQVYFSKSNLWADGDKALHFEDAQWKSTPTSNGNMDASHVSHFTWSDNITSAVSDSYSGDYLFCDESNKVSVDGSEAIYYALSKDEWAYLLNNHTKKWASVNGKSGYVIAPDGFTGELASSYADDAALASAGNLVFLPAAGRRSGSNVICVGDYGYYWSSTAYDEYRACRVYFGSSNVDPDDSDGRSNGYSVRLITESK